VRQKYECVPLTSCVRLRQKGPQEFWGIRYEIFEFAVDGVYCDDGMFADVGVTMFRAGAGNRDQRLEEFHVFGYLFGGNGGLHREYIRLNVPGDNHHEVRGKRIQFHIVLTISFRTASLYVQLAQSHGS